MQRIPVRLTSAASSWSSVTPPNPTIRPVRPGRAAVVGQQRDVEAGRPRRPVRALGGPRRHQPGRVHAGERTGQLGVRRQGGGDPRCALGVDAAGGADHLVDVPVAQQGEEGALHRPGRGLVGGLAPRVDRVERGRSAAPSSRAGGSARRSWRRCRGRPPGCGRGWPAPAPGPRRSGTRSRSRPRPPPRRRAGRPRAARAGPRPASPGRAGAGAPASRRRRPGR